MSRSTPQDVQATFCATLVDEWARCGVRHAVASPGSRSTPMALALHADERIELQVHHDERSGAFMALGIGAATGLPAVVLTTSGSAAAQLHPAVVEADLAGVPLIACTADRPPELIDVGAPQAIDQTHLFGRSVRWFLQPGVPEAAASSRWRAMGSRAVAEATGSRPGPVHLDLAFREPLLGEPATLPPGRDDGLPWVGVTATGAGGGPVELPALAGRRGLLVAGSGSGDGAALDRLARSLGWPVLAAPQAPVWSVPSAAVPCVDAILRSPWADEVQPEVVVHLGSPLASRVAGEWLASSGAHHVAVPGPGRWIDPHATAATVVQGSVDRLVAAWAEELDGGAFPPGGWRELWAGAGAVAAAAVAAALDAEPGITEPAVARALAASLPEGCRLVASSSMPVRELEWHVCPGLPLVVHSNRGANGIDGVVSTAAGIALGAKQPTALLVGDIAFLHDTNGLLGLAARTVDLLVVVVDNDGGGIFSFLPQAQHHALTRSDFELLYGTPHGLDLVAVSAAHGVRARRVDGLDALERVVLEWNDEGGVQVLVVPTDRAGNVAVHRRIHLAVAEALGESRVA